TYVSRAVFTPDGKTVVTGGLRGPVMICDWPTGKIRRKIEHGELGDPREMIDDLVISKDGRRLEVVKGSIFRSFDLETGKALPPTFDGHRASLTRLAFMPDGKLLSAADDNTIRIWDAVTGRTLGRFDDKAFGPVSDIALSFDGALIAVANYDDGKVVLCDRAPGRPLRTIDTLLGDSEKTLVFSPDRKLLAVSSLRGGLGLWEVDTGAPVKSFDRIGAVLPSFDTTGKLVAAGVCKPDRASFCPSNVMEVKVWDIRTGQVRRSLPHENVHAIAFTPNGRTLVCVDEA